MVHDAPEGLGYRAYVVAPDEVFHDVVRVGERFFAVHPPAPVGSPCHAVAPGAFWIRWELDAYEVLRLVVG